VDFFATAAAVWIVTGVLWFLGLRRRTPGGRGAAILAVLLGLVTTFVLGILVMAFSAGWTND
jgi:hypothetical protein